ncbi:MAG: aldo/keto reductase [Bacteroidales bacterium]|nr:aldo/keto reductase [Bacteroidales bacterium]
MKPTSLNRRKFLKNTSLGILGASLAGSQSLTAKPQNRTSELPKIKEYRTLGRTGLKVSDIGAGIQASEGLLKATLEAGVNFLETSELYGRGRNETLIGSVIKDYDRQKLVIATKVSPQLKEFESDRDIIARVNASLERLQTDYVDCLLIHGAENSQRVKNKHFHKAVKQLKKEGKVNFAGVSCHGHSWWDSPEETFEDVLMTAVDDGRFDVIMLPYNFFEPEMATRVLEACGDKNIGTMIMKSNPILLYELFKEEKDTHEKEGKEFPERYMIGYEKYKLQAEKANEFFNRYGLNSMEEMKDGAMQFVLSNKNVSTICCELPNFEALEKYIRLSGTRLAPSTEAMLAHYRSEFGNLHCRIACNECEKACPHHVPINTILRYNYYFSAKKQEKYAMSLYHTLVGNKADICLYCEGYCLDKCPYGVLTTPLLAVAHQNLSIHNSIYS